MKKFFTLIAAALMTVAASAQTIAFTEAASAGSLDGKTIGTGLTLTVTDTGNKVAVDANSCLFGTCATDTVRFAYRCKTGGKSSSSNQMSLVVPSDGILKVYARTGSNSATDRNFVVTNSENIEVINHTCVEANDSVDGGVGGKKCYKPVTADVTAGTYTITYPVSSINFYGFELVHKIDTIWKTTALVSQFNNGGLAEAQRTLLFMSDSTFIVKEAFGEGTSDITMTINKQYDAVDFVGGKVSGYYKYIRTGGADVDTLCIYGAGYASYCYAIDSNADYAYPNKNGGEIICSYAYAYKGQTYLSQGQFYVCWGKKRIYGTKDYEAKATLVGTPATAGTVDGKWATYDKASIGFYHDELKGDTVYRVNNWYGVEGKYFHFRATDNGYLDYVSQYIYTGLDGNSNPYYLYAYNGNYSYTYGDSNYNIKDLTKVRNGEIGFFAYAYDNTYKSINYYSDDWTKNYYILDWENTDVTPTAINAVEANAEVAKSGKFIKNGQLVIVKNGRQYNAAGALMK